MSALFASREFALNYHNMFYHPKRYIEPSMELMFFLISLSIFLAFSVLMFTEIFNNANSVPSTVLHFATFISEAIVGVTYYFLNKRVERSTIDRLIPHTGPNVESVSHAKEVYLSNWFNNHSVDSYTLVKRINYAITISNSNNTIFFQPLPSLLDFIFNSQSKQRTVAWLIFLFSTILLLSIASGGNLDTIFEFVGGAWRNVAASYLTIGVTIAALLIMTIMLIRISSGIATWVLSYVSDGNYKNDEFLKLLMRDIIEYAAPRWFRD